MIYLENNSTSDRLRYKLYFSILLRKFSQQDTLAKAFRIRGLSEIMGYLKKGESPW